MPDELGRSEYWQDISQLMRSINEHLQAAKNDADELTDMNHAEFDDFYALLSEMCGIGKSIEETADTELSNCIKEDRDFQERNWREDV